MENDDVIVGVTPPGGRSGSEASQNGASSFSEGASTENKSAILDHLASERSRVGCIVWEADEPQKIDLTGFEICFRVMHEGQNAVDSCCSDVVLGCALSAMLMAAPVAFRCYSLREKLPSLDALRQLNTYGNFALALGDSWSQMFIVINGSMQRFFVGLFLVFLLSTAERTLRQKLISARNFCSLTSSRRTKTLNLPHFRLNKVRNVRTWLSIRSFLKCRGDQRSVEMIVANTFLAAVVVASTITVQLLNDSESFWHHLGNWDLVSWCIVLGIYLTKFLTLSMQINRKYCNASALITEQINLFLRMEQKREKKEELMMVNKVLRLAEQLIKELESPSRVVSCSAANPLLYKLTKLVVLSAISAVLTELFGFKLKLYNINLRS